MLLHKKKEGLCVYDGPSIKRTIYQSKNLTLYSFGNFPTVTMSPGEKRTMYNLNASVMLGLVLDKSRVVGHYNNGSVFISPNTHFKLLSFFNAVLYWFYDHDTYKDLFYHDEAKDGMLTLNKKQYPNLELHCQFYGKKEQKSLRATPVVVIGENDTKGTEGIILSFNESQSYCMLPYYEVQSLVSIIQEFSFQQEVQIYLETLERIDNGKFTRGYDYSKSSTHQSRGEYSNQIKW